MPTNIKTADRFRQDLSMLFATIDDLLRATRETDPRLIDLAEGVWDLADYIHERGEQGDFTRVSVPIASGFYDFLTFVRRWVPDPRPRSYR